MGMFPVFYTYNRAIQNNFRYGQSYEAGQIHRSDLIRWRNHYRRESMQDYRHTMILIFLQQPKYIQPNNPLPLGTDSATGGA